MPSTGGFAPCPERPATRSPSGVAGLLGLSGIERSEIDAIACRPWCRRSAAEYEAMAARYFEADVPDPRARGEDRDADPDRQPVRGRRRPARQRRRRLRPLRRPLRSSPTSAPGSTSTLSPPTGEYLGGAIAPGVEISLDALTERGARIRRIELAEPASAIGKSTGGAIQSGVTFGFAGLIDGDRPSHRARARWRPAADRHRRAGARDRPVLRDDRRGRRPAHPHRPAADLGAQRTDAAAPHRALSDRRRRARRTASCSRRSPASATGSCACRRSATAPASRSRRWSRASRSPTGNRRTLDEMLRIHPDERPVSIQLFGADPEVMREAAAIAAAGRAAD